ncbi:MAG: hypothetical protein AAGD14_18655, partial [Planctomycetota bacterium]
MDGPRGSRAQRAGLWLCGFSLTALYATLVITELDRSLPFLGIWTLPALLLLPLCLGLVLRARTGGPIRSLVSGFGAGGLLLGFWVVIQFLLFLPPQFTFVAALLCWLNVYVLWPWMYRRIAREAEASREAASKPSR